VTVGLEGELTAEVAATAACDLLAHWAARGHRSHDPYDALAARAIPKVLTSARLPRLALVHLHKRSPINLRPLMGVPKTRNAYAAGHFASAALRLSMLNGSAELRSVAYEHLNWLRSVAIRGGWAYPFDVQTRTFHYSRTTPNVVCSAFAGNAFLDAAELLSDEAALGTANDVARFMVRELLLEDRDGPYFKYLPDETPLIHNGNVLAAQLLVRCGLATGDEALVVIGRDSLRPTLDAIRADGSLLYGRGPGLDWVDGHHTGFVIDGLLEIARRCSDDELMATVHRMATYYEQHLFGPGGAPYSRPATRHPIDAIAGAQGIQTFSRLGARYKRAAVSVATFMLENMRLPSGTYAYQRHQRHTKRVPYARWSDAPMCLALADLAHALRASSNG